jgi:hypothetical protein
MNRFLLASVSASLLCATGAAFAAPPSQIDVMTQNQYLGANLDPVVAACSGGDLTACNTAVVTALNQVAETIPDQRYVALAREITLRRPDVVGLQEAFEFSCVPADSNFPYPAPPGNGCDFGPIAGAFSDHLQGTMDALGGKYVAKAVVENLDIWLPIVTPVGGAYIHVLDRDVILVRAGLDASSSVVDYDPVCGYPSADGCNYTVVAETSIGGVPLRIERGFVGIDVTVGGKAYRVVNTHLEVREPAPGNPLSRYFQAAQAYQLLQTLPFGLAGQQLIVVGDFNSAPGDEPYGPIIPPYMQFETPVALGGGGFTDAWTMRPGTATGRGAPLVGLSCCQDEDLENRHSTLYERIDLVWSLGRPSKVLNARVIGETAASKTMPKGTGLWPSDHAAVAATLRY